MVMSNEKNHIFIDNHGHDEQHQKYHGYDHDLKRWDIVKSKHEHEKQYSCSSSIEGSSTISNGSSSLTCSSSSTFETTDDASSSSANSSGSSLYDLSDLLSHLPIKKGLSKFYHGKSDSFTSLAKVTSIEDLPKKDKNTFKKMKYKSHTLPKPIITKKNSRKKKFGAIMKKEPKE